MAKPKIFISHSAKDNFAVTFRDALYTKLEENDFIPLMDQEGLRVGDMWRQQLYSWMRSCHASVILFSSDALNSNWVFEEVSILNHRHSQEAGFDILPVLLAPVTHAALGASHFSAVAINEIQAASNSDMDTVISEILQRLAPLKDILAEGPLYELENVIDFRLQQIHPRILLTAAQALGVDTDSWPLHVANRLLARELLKIDLDTLPKAIDALKVLTPYLNADSRDQIVTILTSLWVSELAVRAIPQVVKRPAAQRVIRINASRLDTGNMYILRGFRKISGWTMLRVTNRAWSEQQFGALLNEIRTAYAQEIGSEADSPDVESDLLNVSEDDPLFVAIIAKDLETNILARLRAQYPKITFFLITEEIPANLDELKRNFIEFLLPALQPGIEDQAHELYRRAKRMVKSIS